MSDEPTIHRLSAFTDDPDGGNPAGVVITREAPDADWMQAIAKEVGYSETAFLWPSDDGRWQTRYHSPVAEVPFCGHATIAAGVLLGEQDGPGPRVLSTAIGEVAIDVAVDEAGRRTTLTSVEPWSRDLEADVAALVLGAFGWSHDHLAPGVAPVLAFAGARHVILQVRSRAVLSSMAYDFGALRDVMLANDLTTVAAMWRQDDATWHARNAFPVGGVVEDPATGAAAAAFGGWLRTSGQATPPAEVVVHQGADIGRPSRLDVHIPAAGGIRVTGTAVRIPA